MIYCVSELQFFLIEYYSIVCTGHILFIPPMDTRVASAFGDPDSAVIVRGPSFPKRSLGIIVAPLVWCIQSAICVLLGGKHTALYHGPSPIISSLPACLC